MTSVGEPEIRTNQQMFVNSSPSGRHHFGPSVKPRMDGRQEDGDEGH